MFFGVCFIVFVAIYSNSGWTIDKYRIICILYTFLNYVDLDNLKYQLSPQNI